MHRLRFVSAVFCIPFLAVTIESFDAFCAVLLVDPAHAEKLRAASIASSCCEWVRLGPPWAPERVANPADFQRARIADPDTEFHPD